MGLGAGLLRLYLGLEPEPPVEPPLFVLTPPPRLPGEPPREPPPPEVPRIIAFFGVGVALVVVVFFFRSHSHDSECSVSHATRVNGTRRASVRSVFFTLSPAS